MKRQWGNIGAGAFRKGLAVDAVLTGNESVDGLVRAGYDRAKRKAARNAKKAA